MTGLSPRESAPRESAPLGSAPLESVEVLRLRLPLAEPWVSPLATMVDREVLLVAATIDGVVGWGECVAQPEPTYSAEYVDGALDVLGRHLIPRALAAPADVERALAAVKGHPMAKTALSCAVVDARLRARGVRLVDHLAGLSDRVDPVAWSAPPGVPAGVAVGISDGLPALIDAVAARLDEGYRRIKIKIHPGWDVAPVEALRAELGPGLALQVDANGSYGPLGVDGAARLLGPLDGQGLLLIEQPLADDDLLGHAGLGRRLETPICLDESITSALVAESALALEACRVINIKAGRVGGLAEAVAIHDRCAAGGIPVWCGGMLETGVGRAVNLALAALPGFSLPGDLSASARYWKADVVTEPARLESDGSIAVPGGPGIGVEVTDDLAPWTVWSGRWAP